jgi:hypothetical protein
MAQTYRIPENHPLRKLFCALADRALTQSSLSDKDLLLYLTDLLIDFIHVENLYRLKDERRGRLEYLVDMLEAAGQAPQSKRKSQYKQIGDYTLFVLGMFPENLSQGKRTLSHSYYVDTGRRSYMVASELERDLENTVVLKKLAEKYERCVLSLNWVREYTTDPFYQYIFRQFGITP